jgi:hypothetical protein
MRAPSAQLRLTTWLGLLLVLNATIGASLHFAVVQHAVCAEHGETVHVDSEAMADALEEARHGHRHAGIDDGLPGGADGSHEHCAAIMVTREDIVISDVSGASITLDVLPAPRLEVRTDVTSPRGPPLLLLAPKTSPPVHA